MLEIKSRVTQLASMSRIDPFKEKNEMDEQKYFLYVIEPAIDLDSDFIDNSNWHGKLQFQQKMVNTKF